MAAIIVHIPLDILMVLRGHLKIIVVVHLETFSTVELIGMWMYWSPKSIWVGSV